MASETNVQQNIAGEKLADLIIATAIRYRLTVHEAGKAVATAILNGTDQWTEAGRIGVVAEVATVVQSLESA